MRIGEIVAALFLVLASGGVRAADCSALPTWKSLKEALSEARKADNGGLNNEMWGAIVDRDGTVCAVAFTGAARGDQWPGSRLIAAQKANTANGFSLPKMAFSTANLYAGAQPKGFLFGIQHSNPININVAYSGEAALFGQSNDPLVGKRIGGLNVFGGGLGLYDSKGELLGALGVSGDTSCGDHNIAWRTRKKLNLDFVPAGVSPDKDDNIIYLKALEPVNGFKHPTCGGKEDKISLPAVSKAKK